MVHIGLVDCTVCEGTGRKLNRFDPPVREGFGEGDPLDWGSPERSPSGYLVEKEICGQCHGWGKTYGLVMEVTLAL